MQIDIIIQKKTQKKTKNQKQKKNQKSYKKFYKKYIINVFCYTVKFVNVNRYSKPVLLHSKVFLLLLYVNVNRYNKPVLLHSKVFHLVVCSFLLILVTFLCNLLQ